MNWKWQAIVSHSHVPCVCLLSVCCSARDPQHGLLCSRGWHVLPTYLVFFSLLCFLFHLIHIVFLHLFFPLLRSFNTPLWFVYVFSVVVATASHVRPLAQWRRRRKCRATTLGVDLVRLGCCCWINAAVNGANMWTVLLKCVISLFLTFVGGKNVFFFH